MSNAQALASSADLLRTRAQADRRPASVPLLAFGVMTVITAPFMGDPPSWRRWIISAVAFIGCFLLMAAYHGYRLATVGVGAGPGSILRMGLLAGLLVVVLPLRWLGIAPLGVALLVLAWRRRSRYLACWAVGATVLAGLVEIDTFDNLQFRLTRALGLFAAEDGAFSYATSVSYVLLGLVLVVGGLIARRRERRIGNV